MSQLNDISLVAQVVVFKNTRAFDQLVKEYQSPIRRFFLNLTCGDSELSDDPCARYIYQKHIRTLPLSGTCQVSLRGCIVLLIMFFMIIFAAGKETADLDTREIDAINSTEQENIGQKMDVYQVTQNA